MWSTASEPGLSRPYRWNFRKVRDFVYFIDPLLRIVSLRAAFFAARTLDCPVKFRLVFWYEAVVFRRYVLALLSVGLLRKFEAYLVYLSLIWSKNPRRFSFFQKFRHFTYMLLWFHHVIPSFPARIDDMRSRFSALSRALLNCRSLNIWHILCYGFAWTTGSLRNFIVISFSTPFSSVLSLVG